MRLPDTLQFTGGLLTAAAKFIVCSRFGSFLKGAVNALGDIRYSMG